MSSIAFHSPTRTVRLPGSERAYAGILVDRLAVTVTAAVIDEKRLVEDHLNPEHRSTASLQENLHRPGLEHRLQLAMSTMFGSTPLLRRGDDLLAPFSYSLNTVIATGNDAVRLLARLHGQCELHAWVDGPDRAWLAQIIDDGCAGGVLRRNLRPHYDDWPTLAAFLRERDDEPIVTSYSVTDGFPNRTVADWAPEDDDLDGQGWYDLPDAEQWELCMAALRADTERGLQMQPGNWATYTFGHDVSAYTLAV